jgi:Tol biopolymer transport system component
MPDVQEVFGMATQKVRPDEGFVERQQGHQRRRARNRRFGTLALVAAIGVAAAVFVVRLAGEEDRSQPAVQPTPPPAVVAEEVDHLLDLDTGTLTPLPENIDGRQYAASPDGSRLAYVAPGEDGISQIFVADLDGSGVRQVTYDPVGADWPAWSPDGTMIAYGGSGSGDLVHLFVLDVATGEPTQIDDGTLDLQVAAGGLQFTPDGSSLVYTAGPFQRPELRTVPVAGGESTLLIGYGWGGMNDAANGALSPDGSLVTMMGSEIGGPGAIRFVANADGTELRHIPQGASNPAGTWSPDGSRIVCSDYAGKDILVVDIATGDASRVAEGSGAIWLDDHTLLIDV